MNVSTMFSLLGQGFLTTLAIFLLTLLGSLPLGLLVMAGRRSRNMQQFCPGIRWEVICRWGLETVLFQRY